MQGLGNLLGVSYFINFILIIVVVFFQRRDPIVSMAWVLCFILFPVGGMVIFLIFGLGMKRRFPGRRSLFSTAFFRPLR